MVEPELVEAKPCSCGAQSCVSGFPKRAMNIGAVKMPDSLAMHLVTPTKRRLRQLLLQHQTNRK
jgi:hypothetical protein